MTEQQQPEARKSYGETYVAFHRADDEWHAELTHLFGKDAGDARYQKRGKGQPGSRLRTLYEARTAAHAAWDTARNIK